MSGSLTRYLYTLRHFSSRRSGHQKLPKIFSEYKLNQKHLKNGAKKQYYYKRVI